MTNKIILTKIKHNCVEVKDCLQKLNDKNPKKKNKKKLKIKLKTPSNGKCVKKMEISNRFESINLFLDQCDSKPVNSILVNESNESINVVSVRVLLFSNLMMLVKMEITLTS